MLSAVEVTHTTSLLMLTGAACNRCPGQNLQEGQSQQPPSDIYVALANADQASCTSVKKMMKVPLLHHDHARNDLVWSSNTHA